MWFRSESCHFAIRLHSSYRKIVLEKLHDLSSFLEKLLFPAAKTKLFYVMHILFCFIFSLLLEGEISI